MLGWVANRARRLQSGQPAIKPAAGFLAGQVYNRVLTYIYTSLLIIINPPHSCATRPIVVVPYVQYVCAHS